MSAEKPSSKPLGRARRAIAACAKAVGLATVFGAAAGGGVFLHLGLRAPRAFVVAQVNAVLDGTFKGKIVIHRAGVIRYNRLEGVDAEIFDPEGRRALNATGASARIDTIALVRSLVSGDRLIVPVNEVKIDAAEVVIEDNAEGEINLQRAFESKTPDDGSPSRPVEISLRNVQIGHIWAHGHLAAVPIIDADLDHFAGAFQSTPDKIEIDVSHWEITGRGITGLNPKGTVTAHVVIPGDPKAAQVVTAGYEGAIGDIPIRLNAAMHGKQVDATVDVDEALANAIAQIAPQSIHLIAPVSLHAEVHGTLPLLKPELEAHIGKGEVTASGSILLPEGDRKDLNASVKLATRDLDIHLLEASAPSSKITLGVSANIVSHPEGKLSGRFRLNSEVSAVAGQVVPAANVEGEFTESSVRGTASIAEAGAPTNVTFDLHPKPNEKSPGEVTFQTVTEVSDLGAVARAGSIGHGKAHVATSGRIDLDASRIDAKVSMDGSALVVQGLKLGRIAITGDVNGPLANPAFQTKVIATPMIFGPYGFVAISATAGGTPKDIDLGAKLIGDDHTPTLTAHAHLATSNGIALSGIGVDVQRGDVKGVITVGSLGIHGSTVDVGGIKLSGVGEPLDASVRIAPRQLAVKATGPDLDLGRLALLAGKDEKVKGHVTLDVDAKTTPSTIDGHVNVKVENLIGLDVDGANAGVSLTFQGKHVQGTAGASLTKVGKVEIATSDIVLDGPVMDPATWKRISGSVELKSDVELAPIFERLPPAARPISYASGRLKIDLKASRAAHVRDPDIDLSLSTNNLTVVGGLGVVAHPDGSLTLGATPWSIAAIDANVDAKIVGKTGHTDVTTTLIDTHGPLAVVNASADLPVDSLITDSAHAVARLEDLPLAIKIAIPKRSLQTLPKSLGVIPAKGDLELVGHVDGTIHAPTFAVTAKVTNLEPKNVATCGHVVDAEAKVAYDGKSINAVVDASSDGHRAIYVTADSTLDWNQVLQGKLIDWEANGKVALTAMPLDVVGAFVDQPITGTVDGEANIDSLHHNASFHGKLALNRVTFAKGQFPKGTLELIAKDNAFSATARLDQTDGFLQVAASGGLTWGSQAAPTFDATKAIDASLSAKNFRASVAKPFVSKIFSEIDGRVDANLKIHVMADGKDGKADGAVTLREGVIDVPEIGERFHGIKGQLLIKPWGTVRLDNFVAEAPTGHLNASAAAIVNGIALKTATAKLTIKKGESIPISVEGVPMGRAYGDVNVKVAMAENQKHLDINVDIPMLGVDLPQSTGNSVQGLDPDKHVTIGHADVTGFQALALTAPVEPRAPSDLTIRADVKMSHEVEVRRDTTLDVFADGETVIEITDKAHISGQIRLLRGKLELQGKIFNIEKGTVSFIGKDPSNPQIMATAYWDAPGSIRVYAEFSGTPSNGKLELRSEPALSQDEITALILFGSADGSFGAAAPPGQGESDAVQGVGLAGGVVTQGLNKVISGVTTADISTRIDSSEANNPQPQVGMQITKTVSARLGYKLGVPAPGDNPDRAELTVDWRFVRDWSVSTEVGDQGSTALDLVWRKRY